MLNPWLVYGSLCALSVLCLLSLVRCYVPPQKRAHLELVGRVEDLEFAHDEVRQRLTKRAKSESMDKARTAHTERVERRDLIESEAAAIIAQAGAQTPPAGAADIKAALRARMRLAKG